MRLNIIMAVALAVISLGWWLDHCAKTPVVDSSKPDKVAVVKTAKPPVMVVAENVTTADEGAMETKSVLPSVVTTENVVHVETSNGVNVGREVNPEKTMVVTVASKKQRQAELDRKIAEAMKKANQ
jgi:hypothetical protein